MMETELLIAAREIRYAKSTVCVDCSSCIVLISYCCWLKFDVHTHSSSWLPMVSGNYICNVFTYVSTTR